MQIPPLTLFFQAGWMRDAPPSPEWLAFDQEMSWGIMGRHALVVSPTYQTTRPIKALYFDGSRRRSADSASWTRRCCICGETYPDRQRRTGTPSRACGPVRTGKRAMWLAYWDAGLREARLGFEGVVRMNAGFE